LEKLNHFESFGTRKTMKFYQLVDAGQLDNCHFYTIHGIYSHGYLCGQFGYKTVQDNSVILTFFGALFVSYEEENPSRQLLPVGYYLANSRGMKMKYFGCDDTKVFKRVIYEEEQRGTCRRAFQKRAIQQIVSHFLEMCRKNTSSTLFSSLILSFL